MILFARLRANPKIRQRDWSAKQIRLVEKWLKAKIMLPNSCERSRQVENRLNIAMFLL